MRCPLINQAPAAPLLCREPCRGAAGDGWRCRGGSRGDSGVTAASSEAEPAGAAGSSRLPRAAPLHANAERMKCSSSAFQSTREKVSRKIIWKVCLTLERAFIFGKILVTLQGSTACFPARLVPRATRLPHPPGGWFWGAWGSGGDSVVPPGPLLSQGCWCGDAGAGTLAQRCWHGDAGTGMLLAKAAKPKRSVRRRLAAGGRRQRGAGGWRSPGRRQGALPRCGDLPGLERWQGGTASPEQGPSRIPGGECGFDQGRV